MTRRSLLAVLILLAMGAAACSTGGPSAGASPATSADSDVQRALEVGRRFAQCGRDHGIPDFPDPTLYRGRLDYHDAPPQTKEQERRVLAIAECRAILAEAPQLPDDRPIPSAADMQKLREFSQCIREHGIGEWPDPKSDGTFPIADSPIRNESKSSGRLASAVDACRQYWDKGVDVS